MIDELLLELMKHRGKLLFEDAAPALNLIDIVFMKAPAVREAWHLFHISIMNPSATNELRRERYAHIIEAMTQCLGIAGAITAMHVQTAYSPDINAIRSEVEMAELRKRWAELHNADGTWAVPPGVRLRGDRFATGIAPIEGAAVAPPPAVTRGEAQ